VGRHGDIWQSVLDEDVAWHCGTKGQYLHSECRNDNSIGIEMCVCKQDEKKMSATDHDWYFTDKTVLSTIELVRSLQLKYKIPLTKVIRHYDVTGKICPNPFVYNEGKYTWKKFLSFLDSGGGGTSIMGDNVLTVRKMEEYLIGKNANARLFAHLYAQIYLEEGDAEGVRGDLAFCQACLETGNFTFKDRNTVLAHNNFCFIDWVDHKCLRVEFATPREGIRAHIQHLKALADNGPLLKRCVDPFFDEVERGSAWTIEQLGQQEALDDEVIGAGEDYGKEIMEIYRAIDNEKWLGDGLWAKILKIIKKIFLCLIKK
jgi:hypothetical protein